MRRSRCDVVGAVAAGAAGGAFGFEQAAGFVEAQVLHAGADELGGDGDPVHAAAAVWSRHRIVLPKFFVVDLLRYLCRVLY